MRSLQRIVPSITTLEGGGFYVRRPFPTRALDHFDPFLLLDEGGPTEYGPGEAVGAPDHPHRGFETLTYFLDGHFENWDSTGFRGELSPGDLEWTTAGAGIIHGAGPNKRMQEEGGRVHVFQLWINLAAAKKFIPPQSKDVRAENVPTVRVSAATTVTVLAGEFRNVVGPLNPTTPTQYFHVKLGAGETIDLPVPESFNSFAYVVKGALASLDDDILEGQMAIFSRDGAHVRAVAAGNEPVEFLLISGEPLNEPVARYGPFVMNTQQELLEAFQDYQAGKFGTPEMHSVESA